MVLSNNLQQNMPKSISQLDQGVNEKRGKIHKNIQLIHERTRKAIEYYANNKKLDLQGARLKYLQKIGVKDPRADIDISEREERKLKYLLRQSAISKKGIYTSQDQQISLKQYIIEVEPSKNQQPQQQMSKSSQESSLQEANKYQLKQIHYTMLQVQKIIDNFLDFHFTHRKKRSMSKQELVDFLKTTKYGLNCEKYIHLLGKYNKRIYKWQNNRIYCKQISSKQIESRFQNLKERMSRKRVKQIQIMFT